MRHVLGVVLAAACASCNVKPAPILEQQVVVPATQLQLLLGHGEVGRQLGVIARSAAGKHGDLVKQEVADVEAAYEGVRRSFNIILTTIGISLVGNADVPTLEKQMGDLVLTLPPLVGALRSKCDAVQKKIEVQLRAVADGLDGMKKSIEAFNAETFRLVAAEAKEIVEAETTGRKPPVPEVARKRDAMYANLVQMRLASLSSDPVALDSAIAALNAASPQDPIASAVSGAIIGIADSYIHWQQAALEARKGLASDIAKSLKTLELPPFADLK